MLVSSLGKGLEIVRYEKEPQGTGRRGFWHTVPFAYQLYSTTRSVVSGAALRAAYLGGLLQAALQPGSGGVHLCFGMLVLISV